MITPEVPFIGTWDREESYSKLKSKGANQSVHDPDGMQRGFGSLGGFEAAVGEKNLIDASLFALLSQYRRAVCKISCEGIDFRGEQKRWNGTGFLVGQNLLVTNNHVLNSEAVASTASVDFDFERTPEELFQMAIPTRNRRRALQLNPSRLFVTSSAFGGLDYTFVWIEDGALQDQGAISMSRASFALPRYDPVFLIHHPDGELKQASVDDTELLNVDGDLLLYAADTEYGSSGAPVITRHGKLVGLHHARRAGSDLEKFHSKRARVLEDGQTYRVANEGVKFSAIAIDLENRLGSAGIDRSAISEILSHFIDSDSLTGPYGARGRIVESDSTDDQRVIQAYNSTNQDIDIAVWNLEWLNAHYNDAATLKRAATVFADITQDVWVLDGISKRTADALNEVLAQTFSQDYKFTFADDETHPAQPLTALFYNTRTASVVRADWPDHLSDLWRAKAKQDLGLQTVSGPIFPSFPARFKVSLGGPDSDTSLTLLPLMVGKGNNAQLRKDVAALIMSEALELMARDPSAAGDWLIVGDVNTPMRRTRLDALDKVGYTPIMAVDRKRGGFSYLRSQGSLLSQLFVPRGTEPVFDDMGHITNVDKVFEGRFADALSGTTPYGIRVSLNNAATASDLVRVRSRLEDMELAFESGPVSSWRWQGLGKPAFMSQNKSEFSALIDTVNGALRDTYGSSFVPLSLLDMYVIVYCEAGFRNGVIDPDAAHSLGERGLLPLPSNLSFWMGSAAPAHDQLLSLPENVTFYGHYLGHVKNKAVRSSDVGMLYRDLFAANQIVDSPVRQAKLLAGIIHGYFLDQNYRGGRRADLDQLLTSYRSDVDIDRMLSGSGYVHDGTGILRNRQRNIDAALADFAQANPGSN